MILGVNSISNTVHRSVIERLNLPQKQHKPSGENVPKGATQQPLKLSLREDAIAAHSGPGSTFFLQTDV